MKNFKILTVGVLALITSVGVSAADDDQKISKTLNLSGFEKIDVAGVYDMEVRVGADYSIELSGKARDLDRVEASVRSGALYLDQKKRKRGRKHNRDDGVTAVITLPKLSALEISGVVDGTVSNVDANEFTLVISGVGDLEIDGKCGALDARVSGVGDLDAETLECAQVKVRVSGVGDASVYASEKVNARVSGMGDIDVYGSPNEVETSDSMFSSVTVH